MAMPTDFSPTIHDYFKQEFENTLRNESALMVQIGNGEWIPVTRKLYSDIHANAKFGSFYIPPCEEMMPLCLQFAQHPELSLALNDNFHITFSSPNMLSRSTDSFVFTNKTILYADAYLTNDERNQIMRAGEQISLHVEIRDRRYADDKAAIKKRDAFISFDWNNRDAIARPLALALSKMLCPVWYAEFVLRPGDNMRDSIEKGLKECKKCIVIVSKQYLANPGWAKTEFDSIFTRERLEKSKVFIPIWHRVSPQEVYEYCPSFAGTYAVKWLNRKRVDEIAAPIKAQVMTA